MSSDGHRAKRATISDVAALAEVDRALVSRVVNEDPRLRIRPETRQRIIDAVESLHYRPSRRCQNFRTSRSGLVGLIVPQLSNPVWAGIAEAIEQHADSMGISLLIATSGPDGRQVEKFAGLLDEKYVDGLLIGSAVSSAQASMLVGRWAVLLNQWHPPPSRSVIFDDAHAVDVA